MTTPKSIYRVAQRTRAFAQLPNALLRDKNLSLEARGTLAFILSWPDDWQFNKRWLCKEADLGRDRADRILAELAETKYCKRRQLRNADGKWVPWSTSSPKRRASSLKTRSMAAILMTPRPAQPQPAQPVAAHQ